MHDRAFSRIANVFAAHIDPVARKNGCAGREINIVDDLHAATCGRDIEGFTLGVRVRPIEKAWCRAHGAREVNFGRLSGRNGACKIHAEPSQAAITPPA